MGPHNWLIQTIVLEPYARRRWPQMLISWTRLLEGRWRDPLIGRDLLIGSVLGMTMELMGLVRALLQVPPAAPEYQDAAWMGLGSFFASLLGFALPTRALLPAFATLLMVVGLRLVLRSERLAMIAVVAILGLMGASGDSSALAIAAGIIHNTTLVLVATRFGLMALLAWFATGGAILHSFGASLTPPAPLVGPTVLAVIAMLAPGVFGFYTSRATGQSPAAPG